MQAASTRRLRADLPATPARRLTPRPPAPVLPDATRLTLSVPADLAALTTVRQVAGGLAASLGFDPAGIADVRLALNEVCGPSIRGVNDVGPRPSLSLELTGHPGRLHVLVRTPVAGPLSPIPLPLIGALAETVELRTSGVTAETAMTFVASPAVA